MSSRDASIGLPGNARDRVFFLAVLLCFLVLGCASASGPGDEVIVIFNKNLPESKSVADHYAERREIPQSRVWGWDLPTTESMTRSEFEHKLEQPLLKKLRETKLLVYSSDRSARKGGTNEVPEQAVIRYATLCWGVPLKIASDPRLTEEGMDRIRPELRRNEASVDSELALVPLLRPKLALYGALPNPFYGTTNSAQLTPTNGILMVARLDGPTPEIARGLVDKAMEAERDGLWGRAYFDARGITNGNYLLGDEWIRGSAQFTRRFGFETVLDDDPATFSPSFPMSQIALYAGWYDGGVSGPFTRAQVEFMPGAFAYHLHSFNAVTIRSAGANWVGPLLAKGVTATLGSVEEPYLEGTPDIRTFLIRWLYFGFSFGEAAYAAQNSLSWQTTVVGDPLYRPFGRKALEIHEDLQRRRSKLIEWSHLKVLNLNLAAGMPSQQIIEYLQNIPETATSAVLLEKMADLYLLKAKFREAADYYRKALDHSPSPQQQVRLMLSLARMFEFEGKEELAYSVYQDFVKTFPDYPDLVGIYRRLSPLSEQFGKNGEREQYQREISRLTPGATAAKP